MRLKNKTALITGASRGIGKAIALELAQQGIARLILIARQQCCLKHLTREIHQLAPEVDVVVISLDLTQTGQIKQFIPQALSDFGPIDLLVNNAGVAHQASFLSSTIEEFEAEIRLNLCGTFAITRLIAQHMVKHRAGTIVNVSSLMGKLAAPTYSTYSATKFALLGMTQSLRMELASYNVQVVALLPTLTETDMVQNTDKFAWVIASSPSDVAKAFVKGLRSGKKEIWVGWQSKIAIFASYIAPGFVERAMQLSARLGHRQSTRQTEFEFKDCCNAGPS
ncbi:SDR family NAD(P)-dependent oxidoreductase [Acaryochloris marina]|uniref:Short-chain dehydrogenase/reductase SDR n=1 Tax=Acaryochloris marina (strain MBIC 11017) TaxID=329726 RepID=B0C7N6_ACAM1|nr:SDR family NAD(P)-dependent oxidoreductase [Acaryochloris marina]ABW25296.1 short-chain dehydrogenase/reductase SDR [Acaryochloris marina MBIC11017]